MAFNQGQVIALKYRCLVFTQLHVHKLMFQGFRWWHAIALHAQFICETLDFEAELEVLNTTISCHCLALGQLPQHLIDSALSLPRSLPRSQLMLDSISAVVISAKDG